MPTTLRPGRTCDSVPQGTLAEAVHPVDHGLSSPKPRTAAHHRTHGAAPRVFRQMPRSAPYAFAPGEWSESALDSCGSNAGSNPGTQPRTPTHVTARLKHVGAP